MNKNIGDMAENELKDFIVELQEENSRYERRIEKLENQKEQFMKKIIGTKFYSGIEILKIIEELGWNK